MSKNNDGNWANGIQIHEKTGRLTDPSGLVLRGKTILGCGFTLRVEKSFDRPSDVFTEESFWVPASDGNYIICTEFGVRNSPDRTSIEFDYHGEGIPQHVFLCMIGAINTAL
jgi:hypothetical protein